MVEEEVEPPKMIHREKQKRLQRIEEASANLREPMDGKLFCSLTKSQKCLAKLELPNREELKIGWRDLKKMGRGNERLKGHFSC